MMQLITPDWYAAFADELRDMHRLRCRVFKDRLDWDVQTEDGLEVDAFDRLKPHYLLLCGREGHINGCVRLLPSTGPTMVRDTFPTLLGASHLPDDPAIWESSRFALDLPAQSPKGANGIAVGTYELFAGIIEFGLSMQLKRIVTATDLRVERILRGAGWPLERIAEPQTIGNTRAVAGFLDVSPEFLSTLRRNGALSGPVLWAPVVGAAA